MGQANFPQSELHSQVESSVHSNGPLFPQLQDQTGQGGLCRPQAEVGPGSHGVPGQENPNPKAVNIHAHSEAKAVPRK